MSNRGLDSPPNKQAFKKIKLFGLVERSKKEEKK